jgi:hypothetical protein
MAVFYAAVDEGRGSSTACKLRLPRPLVVEARASAPKRETEFRNTALLGVARLYKRELGALIPMAAGNS